MGRAKVISLAILVISIASILLVSGCLGTTGGNSTATDATAVVKPNPVVESVIATTSGTEGAYYAILDIKVKNKGAEGTILVIASVTQAGKTIQNEMPVYLMRNVTHEMKLTFPLVWKGGEWTSNVHTQIP
jgi:hypothetical protein